jgi:hypothetical protein
LVLIKLHGKFKNMRDSSRSRSNGRSSKGRNNNNNNNRSNYRNNKSNRSNKNNRRGAFTPKNLNVQFDSSGPAGKIRGSVKQIIDRYVLAAKEAKSNDDWTRAESCLQHADHYRRIVNDITEQKKQKQEVKQEPNKQENKQDNKLEVKQEENQANQEKTLKPEKQESKTESKVQAEEKDKEEKPKKRAKKSKKASGVRTLRGRRATRKKSPDDDDSIIKQIDAPEIL